MKNVAFDEKVCNNTMFENDSKSLIFSQYLPNFAYSTADYCQKPPHFVNKTRTFFLFLGLPRS